MAKTDSFPTNSKFLLRPRCRDLGQRSTIGSDLSGGTGMVPGLFWTDCWDRPNNLAADAELDTMAIGMVERVDLYILSENLA